MEGRRKHNRRRTALWCREINELSEKLQDHILKFHGLLKVNYVTALLDYYEARVRNSSVDVLGLLPRNQSIFATGND